MSSWLNLNESLNSIKGQITTFANNVLAEEEGTVTNVEPPINWKNICMEKDLQIENLKRINEELQKSLSVQRNGEPNDNNWDWTAPDIEPNDNISDLKSTIKQLENEKEQLINQMEELDEENQQNLAKLNGIKEKLLEENNDLKNKYSQLKQQNEAKEETLKEFSILKTTHDNLLKTFENTKKSSEKDIKELTETNKIITNELQKAKEIIKAAELKSQEDEKDAQKLAVILESYDKQVIQLKEQLNEATKISQDFQKEHEHLKSQQIEEGDNINCQEEITNLNKQLKELSLEKEKMHNTYINIITDNIKHYIDSEIPYEPKNDYSENTHIKEFSKQVENLFKILLEFKEKCETLEKHLYEASNEKTKLLKEKYEEIEKLIQNSENLSQELMKKSEAIQDLEAENANLISSNDLLLSELDAYKNSGLQTISESNEDNMVLLENDLENANKRIEELEKIIVSPIKTSTSSLEANISKKQEDYQELLNSFDNLKLDYDELNYKLQKQEDIIEDLKNNLEKYKSDFENTEYQLSEANVIIEGLKEELDAIKFENKEYKIQNMNNIDLKADYNDIKEKLIFEENLRKQLETQLKNLTEKQQNSKMTETSLKLQYDTLNKEHFALLETKDNLEQSLKKSQKTIEEFERNYTNILEKYDKVLLRCEEVNNKILEKENHIINLTSINEQQKQEIEKLQNETEKEQQLQELTNSRNELINMVTIKHQENVSYHTEIQRLTEILKQEAEKYSQLETKLISLGNNSDELAKKNEEIDKLNDQNNFLKEKCEILTKNLLDEQQLLTEKSKQLERLQSHLMEIQEHYTQELIEAEQKNIALQNKLADLEQREKNSSTMYTSVSIRANQQVEALQSQLQLITNQREELRKKLSDAEDLNNKQGAALANLQFVLEQFQKDKEKDVQKETERIRRQINIEKQIQDELKKEIENLKNQLEESKIGLQAASRLSDQLELQKKLSSGLKDEVSQLQQKLTKTQQTIDELMSQTDGKIDKSLIKSLLVGFLSSNQNNNWNKDQTQVLKLIATVLDFNQQEQDKIKLNKSQVGGSWLNFLLNPNPQTNNNLNNQESLSQAFVRFLENESKPRMVPSLLREQSGKTSSSKDSSSRENTPRASPIVLNEVVLPTFAEFGQSRNSSSILKDVLKDNNS